jgi:filamentous hemagglutinin
LAVTGTSSHTGNATFGNVAGTGLATFTGNITGGNLISNALVYSATLETTGNALIGGNLIVMGNLTYQNVDDLRIEDPVIIMGTGPNGAPLTTNDSMDRGIFMEYYTTARGNAFVGWDNSTGNMIAATSVNFSANNIVNVLSYGTFQAGNIFAQTAVTTGNITGGNLITAGTVNATGNINGTGAVFTGNVTASTFIGNIKGNIDAAGSNTQVQFNDTGDILGASAGFTFDKVANLLTVTGNVNGGNLVTAGQASVTGNITGGNLNTAGQVIATGNITGGNILTSGNIFDTGPITINTGASGNVNLAPNGSNMLVVTTTGANLAGTFNATGNANVGNLGTAGLIVATGNITGGNLVTAGLASVTGNITGGNLTTAGTANIGTLAVTGAATIGTTLNVTGNANVGNLGTAGLIVATGNITGGNIIGVTSGTFANIRISTSSIDSNAGRITINGADIDVDFAVDGDTVANVFYIDAGTGTASFGNATQITNALATFNSTTSIKVPVGTTGERPSTGVTGMVRFNTSLDTLEFYDNDSWTTAGSVFTIIAANTQAGTGSQVAFTLPQAGTTASTIVSINGVVQIPITAYSVTGNVCTFTEAPESTDVIDFRQLTTTSEVAALASASGALIEADQALNQIDVTGNLIPSANVTYDLGSATSRWKDLYLSGTTLYLGNATITATGSGLSSSSGFSTTGNLAVGNIVNSNANGVGNIGSASGSFNTVFARATSAQYADLAEMYEADAEYEPGTVMAFSGTKEVTLCFVENDKRVAGVVSTNPSYLMNSAQTGEFVVPLALQGRVPCKVFGPVQKGDIMVSGSNGRAIVNNDAQPGTIIGKAIENFVGAEGVIEVVVGRF